ncbi:Endonuclease/exonuclease/phosphatase [Trypanosoma melophagium]|uniref:Endonuclease/exonuclease/phosphatase n=1 Tax=Trypanosoma melophagium TaxID=715481 RepID=UPI00351A8CB0|nr:Endonuclease/exonuclease/phosphatase [Trypanosoma melophagium]
MRGLLASVPPSSPFLLCGDFNLHYHHWEPYMEETPSAEAQEFLYLTSDANLSLINTPGEFTFARGVAERSFIDLAFQRLFDVESWAADVTIHSDHCLISYTLKTSHRVGIPQLHHRHVVISIDGVIAAGQPFQPNSTPSSHNLTDKTSHAILRISRNASKPRCGTISLAGYLRRAHRLGERDCKGRT